MKYLLWLVVLLLVLWVLKRSRKPSRQAPETSATPTSAPQEMAVCVQCGVHLPREDAVAGIRGLYCCVAHRADAHDRNPD